MDANGITCPTIIRKPKHHLAACVCVCVCKCVCVRECVRLRVCVMNRCTHYYSTKPIKAKLLRGPIKTELETQHLFSTVIFVFSNLVFVFHAGKELCNLIMTSATVTFSFSQWRVSRNSFLFQKYVHIRAASDYP